MTGYGSEYSANNPAPSSKPQPVMVLTVVSAGLGAFAGVAGLTDLIGVKAALWIVVANVVVTAVLGAWTRLVVVPAANAYARIAGDAGGTLVGGPAAPPELRDKPVTVQATYTS